MRAGAAGAAGGGGAGAAHRLRERRQPAAGPRHRAPGGVRGARRPRRRAASGSCGSSSPRAFSWRSLGGAAGLLLAVWGATSCCSLRAAGHPAAGGGAGGRARWWPSPSPSRCVRGSSSASLPAAPDRARRARPPAAGGRAQRSAAARASARARSALVVAEMALAVLLLVGAGLLIRSFVGLQQADPGFRAAGRARAGSWTCRSPPTGCDAAGRAFYRDLLASLEGLPGARAAGGVSRDAPPDERQRFVLSFEVDGRQPLPPPEQPGSEVRLATPGLPRRRWGSPSARPRDRGDGRGRGAAGGAAERGGGGPLLPRRGPDRPKRIRLRRGRAKT